MNLSVLTNMQIPEVVQTQTKLSDRNKHVQIQKCQTLKKRHQTFGEERKCHVHDCVDHRLSTDNDLTPLHMQAS